MNLKNKNNLILLMQMFVFSGIIGFIYEEIFYYFDLGMIVKRGTTFGPWIPVYGFGTLFITLICYNLRKKPLLVFFLATLISAIVEFSTGYVVYNFFHTRLWDYNVEILNFGNIGGYICLRSVLLFGTSSLFLLYGALPIFEKINSKNNKLIKIVSISLISLFILDMILSAIF